MLMIVMHSQAFIMVVLSCVLYDSGVPQTPALDHTTITGARAIEERIVRDLKNDFDTVEPLLAFVKASFCPLIIHREVKMAQGTIEVDDDAAVYEKMPSYQEEADTSIIHQLPID
jgi:hypothetical protein